MAQALGDDPDGEARGLKLIEIAIGFSIPLAVLQYFFVERYPWLYVPFVLLLAGAFWCAWKVGA